MHKCPWCTISYATWQNQCDQCGGPMPPPPGQDAGPPPPDAPRVLPKGYAFRVRFSRNILVIAGLGFTVVGGILTSVFFFVDKLVALFPLFFFIGGVCMLRLGWKSASSTLRAFRYGLAVKGKIDSITRDHSQSMNGQHPWKLIYHFPIGSHLHEGVLTSFDSTIGRRSSGQHLWVLYVQEDPTQNAVFPPLV